MWPTLCTGALGGMVMVDSSGSPIVSWPSTTSNIRLPFVVAVNQFDGRENLPLEDVRAATNVDTDIPVIGVDARSPESMKGAALRLLDLILARARR